VVYLRLEHTFAGKHSIVNEFFVKTADDNYVAARWCFVEGLDVDFFWLAVHVLEKYLKAALLLNGRPAKSYSHDIVKLYAAVAPLAPELLPKKLPKPEQFDDDLHWREETPEVFLKRLYGDGQPGNRYQLFGYRELAEKLTAMGLPETERNLANKISRGGFTAAFFVQCLDAIGASDIRLV